MMTATKGDGAEAGEAYRSGTKSEHYWAHCTSAYNGKPPSTYLLSCTCIHALQRSTFSSTPSFYWPPSSFYWKFWYPPYWIWKSYWVESGYRRRRIFVGEVYTVCWYCRRY